MSVADRKWAVRITDGGFRMFAIKTRDPEGLEAIELDANDKRTWRCIYNEYDAKQLFHKAGNSHALRKAYIELLYDGELENEFPIYRSMPELSSVSE